ADARHGPADGDDRWIQQAHRGGEDLADVAPRLPHRLDRGQVAVLHEIDDGGSVGDPQLAGDRGSRGERLEAARVAARAGGSGSAGRARVAYVPGAAAGTAAEVSVGADAAADARRDLHEDEIVDIGPRHGAFAERRDVDVVVDEDAHVEVIVDPAANVEVVPPGHDGRVDGAAGRELDGTGKTDAHGRDVGTRAAHVGQQPAGVVDQPGEHGLGAVGDRDRVAVLRQDGAGEVGDRNRGVRRAEVGGDHDLRLRVEGEPGR